jgi:hypothetical protein
MTTSVGRFRWSQTCRPVIIKRNLCNLSTLTDALVVNGLLADTDRRIDTQAVQFLFVYDLERVEQKDYEYGQLNIDTNRTVIKHIQQRRPQQCRSI